MKNFFLYIFLFFCPILGTTYQNQREGYPDTVEQVENIFFSPGEVLHQKPYNGVKRRRLLTEEEKEDLEIDRRDKIRKMEAFRRQRNTDARKNKEEDIQKFEEELDDAYENNENGRISASILKEMYSQLKKNTKKSTLISYKEIIKVEQTIICTRPRDIKNAEKALQCVLRVKILVEEALAFCKPEEPEQEEQSQRDWVGNYSSPKKEEKKSEKKGVVKEKKTCPSKKKNSYRKQQKNKKTPKLKKEVVDVKKESFGTPPKEKKYPTHVGVTSSVYSHTPPWHLRHQPPQYFRPGPFPQPHVGTRRHFSTPPTPRKFQARKRKTKRRNPTSQQEIPISSTPPTPTDNRRSLSEEDQVNQKQENERAQKKRIIFFSLSGIAFGVGVTIFYQTFGESQKKNRKTSIEQE